MRTTREWKYFSIFGYEKEQDYLRQMHRSGWKFTRVSGLGVYHFEESAPEDVIYQLDYNREGLAHKAEYVQMFADCGWEYLQDFMGYSYFRKPAAAAGEDDSIFCDDSSRLAMMERVFKGRMIPLLVLFFALILPQLYLQTFTLKNYILGGLYTAVMILYLAVFAVFAVNYNNFKKK